MHGVSSWGSMRRWWAELSMRKSPVVIRPTTHCSVHAETDFTKNADLVQSDHGRLKTIWIFFFFFFAKLDLRECMVWSYSSLFLFRILIFFLRLAPSIRVTTSWLRFIVLVSKLAYEADWLLIPLPQTELLWRSGGGGDEGRWGWGISQPASVLPGLIGVQPLLLSRSACESPADWCLPLISYIC